MIKQIITLTVLIALTISKTTLTFDVIQECAEDTCANELAQQIISDKLTIDDIQSIQEQINSEDESYIKCMQKQQDDNNSPCYQFGVKGDKEVTPEEFADCINLCGSSYVNKYAVQLLKCTCQTCADGAKCSSQILMFVGLLLTILIL